MTDTQHTPGPWAIYGGVEHAGEFIIHKGVTDIAVTRPAGGDSNANARLIAASPETLDALKELVAAVERFIHPQPDKPDSAWAKLVRARAAIAEATGQTD